MDSALQGYNVTTTFADRFDVIASNMKSIMLEKRKLRGTDNIQRQGIQGVVTRMGEDKLARVQRQVADSDLRRRMIERGVPIDVVDRYVPTRVESSESLEDDLMDIANYSIIAIMLLRDEWRLADVDTDSEESEWPQSHDSER